MKKINNKRTTEDFISEAKKTHGNKYDYKLVNYVNNHTKVLIVCKQHGEFWQNPYSHLVGHGCRKCAKIVERDNVVINRLNKKFKYLVQPEHFKIIPLTKGRVALVDNDIFEKIKHVSWSYNRGYAINEKLGLMHRFIMNAPNGVDVDHIVQENKSDNRRSNLRLATGTQNTRNSRPTKNSTSDYKGVSWCKKRSVWRANIYINSKQTHLGYFNNEEEAARAYDIKALECWGEFAYLNFPELKEEYLKEIK